MKTLILMRHGKASKDEAVRSDFERSLTEKGLHEARDTARKLKKSAYQVNQIVSSPARRTTQTARAAADELGISETEIIFENGLYEAGFDELLKIIRRLDDQFETVMLVGHNPVFTSIIGMISDKFVENLPTAGIAVMRFNTETWKMINNQSGTFLLQISPKEETD